MALRFTDPDGPGIRRIRKGRGWCFIDPDGRIIRCADTRARLLALALPPAYRGAWYNPDAKGHIQAHGIDARGRRQYRYHPDYRARQDAEKYARLADFGQRLPRIRRAAGRALRRRRLDQERVIAAVVRLLDLGQLRIGNESYARANRSYGATTLRRRHAKVSPAGTVHLRFRGKGGVERRVALSDRALARTIRQCQELPGQHLFVWEDAEGTPRRLGSEEVNAWLRATSRSEEMSARQFRTWWASVLALEALATGEATTLSAMLGLVAGRLGNTPAVTRRSYVHPDVIAVAKGERPLPRRPRGPMTLSPPERRLMGLLLTE